MALTPNSAYDLVRSILAIYVEAEEVILTKLARRLARGIDEESWYDQKYADLQQLNRELRVLLDQLDTQAPDAVEKAMQLAYGLGATAAVTEAVRAGLQPPTAPNVNPAVRAFTVATLDVLQATDFRILRWSNDVYNRVTQETTAQVVAGTATRREASAAALKKYAAQGITGFVDKSGRNWSLPSYTEMAARTQAAQAALQGHTDRISALGIDTVIVSDAPQECILCRPWEGQILSISGRTTGRLSDGNTVKASVAVATAAGLYHPSCRHSQTIYLPGITKRFTDTEDPEGDKLRQRQRALERRVREWRRRVIIDDELLGKDSEGARRSRKYLNTARADLKKHIEDNDLKTLAYRTSLTNR